MLLYYIRHGDPIYAPDSLPPLGERRAEAVGRRLAVYGPDAVYTSPSNRARLTGEADLRDAQAGADGASLRGRRLGGAGLWGFHRDRRLDVGLLPSGDGHLYREGIGTRYQNWLPI